MKLYRYLLQPGLVARRVIRRLPGLSLQTKLDLDWFPRPYFAYGLHQAATQAGRLGMPRMSAIEFGVAGGSGLVILENVAAEIGRATGVAIDVYGFDTGGGLPPPADVRDLPYVWRKGFYTMDERAVRAKLKGATLVLGPVADTVASFVRDTRPAPVGFVSFDLDYYTSTTDAFRLFDLAPPEQRLPRVFCYFDDVIGTDEELHCEHVGELAAIADFNAAHPTMKFGRIHALRHKRIFHSGWCEQMFVLHDLAHPRYGDYVSAEADKQLPLR